MLPIRSVEMRRSLVVLALVAVALPGACRRGPPPRITLENVERCELGIELEASQPTQQEATAVLYRECSDTVAEPACKQAFLEASKAPLPKQAPIVVASCAKAYCPFFAEQKLLACEPGFENTPIAAALAWPALHEAILDRDASGYAPRLKRAFLGHGLTMMRLAPPPSAAPP